MSLLFDFCVTQYTMYSTYAVQYILKVYLDFIYLHTWINFASQTIYEISLTKMGWVKNDLILF